MLREKMDVMLESPIGLGQADTINSNFSVFCELVEDDVILDTNCTNQDFIVSLSNKVEHILGIVSSPQTYECLKVQLSDIKNLNLVNCKLDKLPFKRDMFSLVVNRFSLCKVENPSWTFNELVKYTGTTGRLCIQDFTSFGNPKLDNFFDRFDYLVFKKQTPMQRLTPEIINSCNMKIINQEIREEETTLMWYISAKSKALINIDQLNQLVNEALSDKELSEYVYLKNDMLVLKRKLWSVMLTK